MAHSLTMLNDVTWNH